MNNEQIVERWEKTLAFMTPENWCRTSLARNVEDTEDVSPNDPNACRFCLLGAYAKVNGLVGETQNHVYDQLEVDEGILKLAGHVPDNLHCKGLKDFDKLWIVNDTSVTIEEVKEKIHNYLEKLKNGA